MELDRLSPATHTAFEGLLKAPSLAAIKILVLDASKGMLPAYLAWKSAERVQLCTAQQVLGERFWELSVAHARLSGPSFASRSTKTCARSCGACGIGPYQLPLDGTSGAVWMPLNEGEDLIDSLDQFTTCVFPAGLFKDAWKCFDADVAAQESFSGVLGDEKAPRTKSSGVMWL